MHPRFAFVATAIAIVALGVVLRVAWLRSDPPTHRPIGIVWHDEGAWVHNARNRALWGAWRTDAWNPVFVTPVFTALEYSAFRAFGVGTWQARTVPVASGIAAVVLLMVGLHTLSGRRAALAGGTLLATSYVFVMWNRAALIESTMVAFMVASWSAYALAERRPRWAVVAGAAASLAWFTKAAAAFFVVALVLDALWSAVMPGTSGDPRAARRAGWYALSGLAGVTLIVAALFVWPHWSEYYFYNWQMSVTRKPDYTLSAIVDRITWLPLVQGTFGRMWPVLVAGAIGLFAGALRWRRARPADRLLMLWVVLGLAELVVHDSGNERRYLMFVPVLIALATTFLAGPLGTASHTPAGGGAFGTLAGVPMVVLIGYLVVGSALRIALEEDVMAGRLSTAVRVSAAMALLVAVAAFVWRRSVFSGLDTWRPPRVALPALVVLAVAWNVRDYADWLRHRGELNYDASVAIGQRLPPETLVQGKLANGLALDNRLRPLFVGNGFGNYADRLSRDGARYILTYDLPRIGYESSDGSGLIQEILGHYPERRVIATFTVDETPDPDRAILVEKTPAD